MTEAVKDGSVVSQKSDRAAARRASVRRQVTFAFAVVAGLSALSLACRVTDTIANWRDQYVPAATTGIPRAMRATFTPRPTETMTSTPTQTATETPMPTATATARKVATKAATRKPTEALTPAPSSTASAPLYPFKEDGPMVVNPNSTFYVEGVVKGQGGYLENDIPVVFMFLAPRDTDGFDPAKDEVYLRQVLVTGRGRDAGGTGKYGISPSGPACPRTPVDFLLAPLTSETGTEFAGKPVRHHLTNCGSAGEGQFEIDWVWAGN